MSEQINKFCDDLKPCLNDIESQLMRIKDKISTASKDAEATIKAKLEETKKFRSEETRNCCGTGKVSSAD